MTDYKSFEEWFESLDEQNQKDFWLDFVEEDLSLIVENAQVIDLYNQWSENLEDKILFTDLISNFWRQYQTEVIEILKKDKIWFKYFQNYCEQLFEDLEVEHLEDE